MTIPRALDSLRRLQNSWALDGPPTWDQMQIIGAIKELEKVAGDFPHTAAEYAEMAAQLAPSAGRAQVYATLALAAATLEAARLTQEANERRLERELLAETETPFGLTIEVSQAELELIQSALRDRSGPQDSVLAAALPYKVV